MHSTESARQKLLYHYTTAESLLGIVQSRSLWATDIRFLNDTAEFSFARDVLLRELLSRANRLRNERVRLLIRKELATLQVMAPPPAYVISLSERGNALSQWRAYAPRDGVSIGFHIGALRAIKDFALYRCRYLKKEEVKTERGKHALRAIVDEVYGNIQWTARLIQQEARKKTLTDNSLLQAQRDHTALVASALVWAALKIKHGGFSEEVEWRLIDNVPGLNVVHALGDDPKGLLRFRRGAFGVTPYLVATLPQSWRKAPLGIAKVIVGPSASAVSTVASIRDLFRIKLRSSATVESCEIPFRAW
jgi:Protein of unknown function (DUF2971).